MTCPATSNPSADLRETPDGASPPKVRLPKLLQGIGFAFFQHHMIGKWIKRYGRIFEINIPFFGRTVVVADPALVKEVWTAGVHWSTLSRISEIWWGPERCSHLTTSRIAIGGGYWRRLFTGQCLTGYEQMIVCGEHCAKSRSGPRTRNSDTRTDE